MNDRIKYILGVLLFILAIWLFWYFKSIVLFVVISAVLSLVSRPIFDFIKKFRLGNKHPSNSLAALCTLLFLWVFILLFFRYSVPIVIREIQFLSEVDLPVVFSRVEKLFKSGFGSLNDSWIGKDGVQIIEEQLKEAALTFFDFAKISDVVSSVAGFLGGTFVFAFATTFITFFFLKEDWLLMEGILLIVPVQYEEGLEHVLSSVRQLLRRYFIGILFQIVLICFFVTSGFMIIGVSFEHAIVVGLFSGFINVIPYLGPLIGAFFGMLVGLIVYLQMAVPPDFIGFLWGMILVYLIVQLLDNMVFQPVIFSSSVKAHPLEIFIVILMAGYMSGIPGMFFAIPVYTIIRVVAREFFFNYKLVKKLTRKL
ncbi:AI-2E family transporter [Marinilabiliaceae bacterium JC017]|nr:AI-2E family transporter [Marinilabiliaceae bacterium JC017]